LVGAALNAGRTLDLLRRQRFAYEHKPRVSTADAIQRTKWTYLRQRKILCAVARSSVESLRDQGANLRTTLVTLREIVAKALCPTGFSEQVCGSVLAEISSTSLLEYYSLEHWM
jgi:hypothetical protein